MWRKRIHIGYCGKARKIDTTGRSRRKWGDSIKMDLREIECDGADWIDMAQDRDQLRTLTKTILNLLVP
jgi:hypothetical protein